MRFFSADKKTIIVGLFVLVMLLSLGALAACQPPDEHDGGTGRDEIVSSLTFADSFGQTDLPNPGRIIENSGDFIYAMDWLAFYRISEETAFEISDGYAGGIESIFREFSGLRDLTELADVYPLSLGREYYNDYKIITLTLRPTDIADKEPDIIDTSAEFILPFDYNPNLNKRASDYDSFAIMSAACSVAVTTGEQLWYAAEHGYRPVPTAGSTAEKIYREAKDVLRRIVSDDMTDYEKLKAIYNFLTCEVRYDRATADGGGGEAYRAQCYYLEGVFFNRFAVCDGKAKAYCLLAAMEGIEAVRVTDFNDDFQGHSYNYVNLDGKWYLSCATYGSAEMNFGTDDNPDIKIVPQYNMFLTSVDTSLGDGWTYDSGMFPEIKAAVETEPFDYWAFTAINVSDNLQNLVISSADGLAAVLEAVESQKQTLTNTMVEFRLEGEQTVDEIYDIISAEFEEYDVFLVQSRPLDSGIYGVIFCRAG